MCTSVASPRAIIRQVRVVVPRNKRTGGSRSRTKYYTFSPSSPLILFPQEIPRGGSICDLVGPDPYSVTTPINKCRLQKVVWHASFILLPLVGARLVLNEAVVHVLIHHHDGGLITTAVAVVRSAEYRNTLLLVRPLKALHNELVSADDEIEAVAFVELLGDISAEGVSSTSRRDPPSHTVIRIRPDEVTDRPLVRNFLGAVECLNLVDEVKRRREPCVWAENLAIDRGRERQVVEHLHKHEPHGGRAVLPKALVVKAVHLRNLPRLVVTTEQTNPARISNLEQDAQLRALD
mmetsp:Transcript_16148/g.37642  ORF Transcript_16148/g.37642 Transcript_16148/m.37642 type:complete len:292 (-) Transcript_16148:107-982(-)